MSDLSRREFVTRTLIAATAMQLTPHIHAQEKPSPQTPAPATGPHQAVELHWLDGRMSAHLPGTTWGVPWPRGAFRPEQPFALKTQTGEEVPVQTWPTATWPDGSLKWTAHAIGPGRDLGLKLALGPGVAPAPAHAVVVREDDQAVEIDTGVMRCTVGKRGSALIESIERDGRCVARDGHLVLLRQDQPLAAEDGAVRREKFISRIEKVAVEQSGPIRAVVRIEGKHKGPSERAWLPFVLRLYFYAGGDSVRIVHTFIFDGDEHKDFICGIGVRFAVPMRDALHDRHVRFVGEGDGLWAEAVRGLTGLRREPGPQVRAAQVEGRPTPPTAQFAASVGNRLGYIPAWGDYTLSQLSADGFAIRKRTASGYGWIAAGAGRRAAGVGYVGGISGGVAFGLRDFWQRHPTQLDIRSATTDQAEVTLWLYSPEAPAMDLRFYHDGLGMQTHMQELEALQITYEDYEKGFGTPVGIARTSELMLWALPATPSRRQLVDFAATVRTPPLLACDPKHHVATKVFGGLFNLPDRSTPAKARIEDRLDLLIGHYQKQIEQHRWYGFWDYGDVMHSYDADRHVWRYDVGGYAWANSELSPDLWLWYSFLRSGRADIFRMAEAMTRHTGEVDVHHLGRFQGLGSRHNVQHWGCSAKQHRISNAAYRRFYYFLTADERSGDLMRELVDSDRSFLTIDPIRKLRREPYTPQPNALAVGFGTDWGSLAAAWLTEWERSGDEKCRQKLINGMKSIGAMPHGFFSSGGGRYDLETGSFSAAQAAPVGASHLSAVFGLVEIAAELIALLDVPEFEKAWLQYCELYNGDPEQQQAQLGRSLPRLGLRESHSRLTAYAARRKNDPRLAERAWSEFLGDPRRAEQRAAMLQPRRIEGPDALNPVDEIAWIGTNGASQWSLAAIQLLALVGDALPSE